MTKLEKVATMHNCNLWGGGGLMRFVPLQEQFAENTNKSYYVCKVIDTLHIYHKIFGIRYAGPPANKIKILARIKFLVVYINCLQLEHNDELSAEWFNPNKPREFSNPY